MDLLLRDGVPAVQSLQISWVPGFSVAAIFPKTKPYTIRECIENPEDLKVPQYQTHPEIASKIQKSQRAMAGGWFFRI